MTYRLYYRFVGSIPGRPPSWWYRDFAAAKSAEVVSHMRHLKPHAVEVWEDEGGVLRALKNPSPRPPPKRARLIYTHPSPPTSILQS